MIPIGAILSIVARKTKHTLLHLLPNKTALETTKTLLLKLYPIKENIKTITSDTGKEFAGHEEVAKILATQFFFARPYHSWERGLNENTNELVRQYFPKGLNFSTLTQKQVLNVKKNLTINPRKTLCFRTSNEEFYGLFHPEALMLFGLECAKLECFTTSALWRETCATLLNSINSALF